MVTNERFSPAVGASTATLPAPITAGDRPDRSSLDRTVFNRTQVRRGLVLIAVFIGLRTVLSAVFGVAESVATPALDGWHLAFVGLAFLLGSVGLVYLGFTYWVRVDLVGWWVDRRRLWGDLGWGVLGWLAGMLILLGLSLAAMATGLVGGPPPAGVVPTLAEYAVLLAFGLGVAAFQEETIFRGFLQTWLRARLGPWPAIVIQAAAFSLAHIGYFPLDAPHLYVFAFGAGLLFGWLRQRRGRLLAPGIAHGLIG